MDISRQDTVRPSTNPFMVESPLEPRSEKKQAILPRIVQSASLSPLRGRREPPAPASPEVQRQEPRMRHLAEAVGKIAKIVFEVMLSAALYCAHPSLFFIGFVCGIVFNQEMKSCVNKVGQVWKRQTWLAHSIMVGLMIITFPMTLATSTFFVGGYVGTRFSVEDGPQTPTVMISG